VSEPLVTVLCATRDACAAVQLTLCSFRRHTAEPCHVVVADNGSSDGTLGFLRSLDWLTVISLDERRAALRADAERARAAAARLAPRLDSYAETLPDGERALLDELRRAAGTSTADDDEAVVEHGATLDWLVRSVRTPFFLTLDSDVEFLEEAWLSDLLDLARREGLAAVGELQPAMYGQKPRLAPHVLLVRTRVFRDLCASLRPFVRIADDGVAERWRSSPPQRLDPDQIVSAYPTAEVFPPGAGLLERLRLAGERCLSTPPAVRRKYFHLGHMSWAAGEEAWRPSAQELREHHREHAAYARRRLRSLRAG
jgi:hypothetical protein